MKLTRRGTPRAALAMLKDGPIQRKEVFKKLGDFAQDDHTAAQALHRLQAAGLIVCEFRLLPEGAKALEECPCTK